MFTQWIVAKIAIYFDNERRKPLHAAFLKNFNQNCASSTLRNEMGVGKVGIYSFFWLTLTKPNRK